jgi:hypothetical protein
MPPYLTHLDIRHAFIPGPLMGCANEVFDDLCFASCTMLASNAPARNAPRAVVLLLNAIVFQ